MRTTTWAPARLGGKAAAPTSPEATFLLPAEPAAPAAAAAQAGRYARADGLELIGPLQGAGYRKATSLVRRPDGRMVQLGPILYAFLECLDRPKTAADAAVGLSSLIGRRVTAEQVDLLAAKLAQQGLLAGTEHSAPPAPNPLMALRWKLLVTRPGLTRALTAPFTFLFRPWVMWPALVGFGAVFWFVLIHKGVASATAQAFNDPGLLVLVFALGIISAGFHELGHAAACRYGGAQPAGFGMGLYLVWPCFYTDVTDAYRLPRRDRLRVDLAGLYFNALVAVATMIIWLAWRRDALLLLVALQLLQMVKQLSPIIRADGYHILSDATGVPDLYAHMGSTLRSLLPGRRRRPSVLRGWTRVFVTFWVLVMIPVLGSLMLGAVLLLPRLLSSAWTSGRRLADLIPQQASAGQTLHVGADLVELLAILLPVIGSLLMTQKFIRTYARKAQVWSQGRPYRRLLVTVLGTVVAVGLAYAWWPSGQYQPVRADQKGTIGSLVPTLAHPEDALRPTAFDAVHLGPGTYLAVAMVPTTGASSQHPAVFVVPGKDGHPPVTLLSTSGVSAPSEAPVASGPPDPPAASVATTATSATDGSTDPPGQPDPSGQAPPEPASANPGLQTNAGGAVPAIVFPFKLPARPGPGETQALALGQHSGGVVYDVAYSLVTVSNGRPVTNRNSAYALASCHSCTTVAVSVQVILVVGQSKVITPINTAEALNSQCPACATTAIADQIVVTLKSRPTPQLVQQITASLQSLDALPALGAGGTPQAVAAQVTAVQDQIDNELASSGQVAVTGPDPSTTTEGAGGSTPSSAAGTTTTSVAGSSTTSTQASSTSSATGASSPTSSPSTSSSTTSSSSSSTSTSSSSTSTSSTSSTTSSTTTTTAQTSSG